MARRQRIQAMPVCELCHKLILSGGTGKGFYVVCGTCIEVHDGRRATERAVEDRNAASDGAYRR